TLVAGKSAWFAVPPVEADRFALITDLAWSHDVPDGEIVAQVRLHTSDGKVIELPLRAGVDTAEWSHDRADILSRIKHRLATPAASYTVRDLQGEFAAHSY